MSLRQVWIIGLALTVLACPAIPPPLERPLVTIESMDAAVSPDAELLVHVRLRAVNPNGTKLDAHVLDWEIAIGDTPSTLRGRTVINQSIPARASALMHIELALPAAAAGDMASRLASGMRQYRLRGTLHVSSAAGELGAIFDQQGEVAARPAP